MAMIGKQFFKLRLGALIPRSVCLSVCRSVGRSVLQKLQNFTKHCKALQNILEDRQGSFGIPLFVTMYDLELKISIVLKNKTIKTRNFKRQTRLSCFNVKTKLL